MTNSTVKDTTMGIVIDMLCNKAIVRKNARGWVAIIIEDGRRVIYQFEREDWARKFADDQRTAWPPSRPAQSHSPQIGD